MIIVLLVSISGITGQDAPEYATEHSNHPYLLQIAKVLDEDAKALGYTGFKLAEYLYPPDQLHLVVLK